MQSVRTCIGCRQRTGAADLLRVVAASKQDGVSYLVMPDPGRTFPGRGAWLHHNPECLALAVKRRAFGRALRMTGQPDVSPVVKCIT